MSYLQNGLSIETAVGTVIAYPGQSVANGWLLCDGTAYSRTTYSALFGVIGTAYGVGNGTTTFNVPNFQAAFLRGAGSQTYPTGGATTYGYTTGTSARTMNTPQGTALQTHGHTVNDNGHTHTFTNGSHSHGVTDDGHTHTYGNVGDSYGAISAGASFRTRIDNKGGNIGIVNNTSANPVNINSIGGSTSGVSNVNDNSVSITIDNSTTNANTNESFPFNYAINWIIKY